jgi:hypothetical protein
MGDFLVAAHILIPQIEHSVRHILFQQHNVVPSGLDNDGVQNEFDLNKTLYFPAAEKAFGEDTLFDLRGLLVEHTGSNFRNLMAHGMLEHVQFHMPEAVYVWWMSLHLTYLGFRMVLVIRQSSIDGSLAIAASLHVQPFFLRPSNAHLRFERALDQCEQSVSSRPTRS